MLKIIKWIKTKLNIRCLHSIPSMSHHKVSEKSQKYRKRQVTTWHDSFASKWFSLFPCWVYWTGKPCIYLTSWLHLTWLPDNSNIDSLFASALVSANFKWKHRAPKMLHTKFSKSVKQLLIVWCCVLNIESFTSFKALNDTFWEK